MKLDINSWTAVIVYESVFTLSSIKKIPLIQVGGKLTHERFLQHPTVTFFTKIITVESEKYGTNFWGLKICLKKLKDKEILIFIGILLEATNKKTSETT